ncbi:hypothetical protein KR018_000513, partial [Drosophila ironensis]
CRKMLCKLCKNNNGIECDLEESKFKSANQLLQRLFESYQIDLSVLSEESCICETCLDDVVHLGKALDKWSTAQWALQDKPLDIDDSDVFQVKLEDEEREEEGLLEEETYEEETLEEETLEDEMSENEIPEDEMPPALVDVSTCKLDEKAVGMLGPRGYFAAGIARDGLVLTKLVTDKTKAVKMLCTCCDQLVDTLANIRAHINNHRLRPYFMCRYCGLSYANSVQLRKHVFLAKHIAQVPKDYKVRDLEFRCLECGDMFDRFFAIIRHENSVHTAMEFKCRLCQTHYKYRGSFEKHMRERHPKLVPQRPGEFLCKYPNCHSKFRVLSRYEGHLRMHSVLKECRHAGCNFKLQPKNYRAHMKAHAELKKNMKFPMSSARMGEFLAIENSKRNGQFINLPKKLTLRQGKYIPL